MVRALAAWWWSELAGMVPRRRLARVPDELVIQRTLDLPLATERNLRAVLAFEMDRYTPFKADAVYYGFKVASRDQARRTLRLVLMVVPRAVVAPGLDAVEAGGMRLTLHGASDKGRLRLRLLGVLLVALAGAALALPIVRKMQEVERLESEVDPLRRQALLAEAARKDLERLLAEARALPERRSQRPPAIEVLRELTVLLPDHSWLSHVELGGGRVRLRGESPNASELVPLIEKSALFADASFDGSVTRDPGADRERFSLSAAVRAAP